MYHRDLCKTLLITTCARTKSAACVAATTRLLPPSGSTTKLPGDNTKNKTKFRTTHANNFFILSTLRLFIREHEIQDSYEDLLVLHNKLDLLPYSATEDMMVHSFQILHEIRYIYGSNA